MSLPRLWREHLRDLKREGLLRDGSPHVEPPASEVLQRVQATVEGNHGERGIAYAQEAFHRAFALAGSWARTATDALALFLNAPNDTRISRSNDFGFEHRGGLEKGLRVRDPIIDHPSPGYWKLARGIRHWASPVPLWQVGEFGHRGGQADALVRGYAAYPRGIRYEAVRPAASGSSLELDVAMHLLAEGQAMPFQGESASSLWSPLRYSDGHLLGATHLVEGDASARLSTAWGTEFTFARTDSVPGVGYGFRGLVRTEGGKYFLGTVHIAPGSSHMPIHARLWHLAAPGEAPLSIRPQLLIPEGRP